MATLQIAGRVLERDTQYASFYRCQFGDVEELAQLTELSALHGASFCGTNLNDRGLALVCRVRGLENLDLQDTQVSNAGLAALTELPNLNYLRLKENDQLTNACTPHLGKLFALEQLGIHETSIDEAGLEPLLALTNLRDLCLQVWDDNFSFEGLRAFSERLPQCTVLAKGRGEFLAGQFDGEWRD